MTQPSNITRESTRSPLQLSTSLREELTALACRGYPQEVCGLLVGRETGRGAVVEQITRAANLATERLADRYLLDPQDYLRADTCAQRDGLEIVGVWHTHPDRPARPSATDLAAAWAGYTYLILSVRREGLTEIRAWTLEGNAFTERPIEEVTR